ncbi:hypothetical protein SUGI_1421110, partial [Cryptomeria japonica]
KVGNANPIRSTYVLPDGIKHNRGFVKDPEEAQRYMSTQEKEMLPTREEENEHRIPLDVETVEDRSKEASAKNEELKLTNERFLVPEMLFHPADLGMNQAGLAECIVRAVNSCHPHLHPVLFSSIILTGGSSLFPRMKTRLEQELRPLVCDDYKLKIVIQEDPMLGAWRGGSLLAASPDFESLWIFFFAGKQYFKSSIQCGACNNAKPHQVCEKK